MMDTRPMLNSGGGHMLLPNLSESALRRRRRRRTGKNSKLAEVLRHKVSMAQPGEREKGNRLSRRRRRLLHLFVCVAMPPTRDRMGSVGTCKLRAPLRAEDERIALATITASIRSSGEREGQRSHGRLAARTPCINTVIIIRLAASNRAAERR